MGCFHWSLRGTGITDNFANFADIVNYPSIFTTIRLFEGADSAYQGAFAQDMVKRKSHLYKKAISECEAHDYDMALVRESATLDRYNI